MWFDPGSNIEIDAAMRLPALLVTACAVVPATGYHAVPRTLADRAPFHRQTRSNHPHSRRHAVGDPDRTDTDTDDAPPPPLQGRDSGLVQRFIYPQLAAAALATAALLSASPFSSSFADGPTVTAVLTPDSSPTSTTSSSRPGTGMNLRGGAPPDVGAILRDRIAFVTSEVTGEKLGQVRRARPVHWLERKPGRLIIHIPRDVT